MESTEKSINNFLLDMIDIQKPRIKQFAEFLTKAEKKLFESMDIDNIPLDQMGTLAKVVSECQGNLITLMEMARKMVAGNTKISTVGNDEKLDEMNHLLNSLNGDEIDALKSALSKVRPGLKLVSGNDG